MEVDECWGLRVLRLTAEEALAGAPLARGAEADVARVADPPRQAWPALHAMGFTPKPAWITWVLDLTISPKDYLARLGSGERRAIRVGERAAREARVTFAVQHPLDVGLLDEFLGIYIEQIAGMPFGVPFAAQQRDALLVARNSYHQISAFVKGLLVGGCLCKWDSAASCLTIRFTTTRVDSRQSRLVRPLYMRAIALAQELGARTVSLGSDPTLYGHIAQPGLFEFKARLGFVAVPAGTWEPEDAGDEADLILSMARLTPPCLLVGYGPGARPVYGGEPVGQLRWAELTVVGGDDSVEQRYDAGFLTGLRMLPSVFGTRQDVSDR
ncbi:MAG: hypothetical protein ACYDH5_02860 [Acidimicrobiales bacterium]